MSRITHDVSRLRDFIANGLQDIVGDSLTIIFMCAIMGPLQLETCALDVDTDSLSYLLHDLFWEKDEQGVPRFVETICEH